LKRFGGDDAIEVTALKRGASAPERRNCQRGESPLRAYALRPVAACNCVVVRRGGEQQEANDQSVG